MTSRILVGDLQGCRVELERLLELVRFDPAADELHPVGDFVGHGGGRGDDVVRAGNQCRAPSRTSGTSESRLMALAASPMKSDRRRPRIVLAGRGQGGG